MAPESHAQWHQSEHYSGCAQMSKNIVATAWSYGGEVSVAEERARPVAEPAWSSGVVFYPPSEKYWRIGGKWYDFEDFLDAHPGGRSALLLCRDRFEDCTFVFESHHHDYKKARAMIRKYEVSEKDVLASGSLRARPLRGNGTAQTHFDSALEMEQTPKLLPHDAFYSVMRQRVTAYLKKIGHPSGGPRAHCIALFWVTFAVWFALWVALYRFGSPSVAIALGLTSSWLGAFGHNWVHQPQYKLWAYLSLDAIGFSSDGWFREHNLQHHMYTNTPWDNHFRGTDPFLVTDPTVKRNFIQQCVTPYLHPVILTFGLYGNYIAWAGECARGHERFTLWRLCLPMQIAWMVYGWGAWGLLLAYISHGILGLWYFTMALMNHNAEHTMNVDARNKSRDWGEAQLQSSADWCVESSFLSAGLYLWLNYHTVHHMFPKLDFSHHSQIQQILMQTCEEFNVRYATGNPLQIYKEMVESFRTPQSLMKEIVVYSGGL